MWELPRYFCLSILVLSGACIGSFIPQLAFANPPKIVVTIKPVHSLVAAVTRGITEPLLLLDGVGSPHTVQLKPSGIRAMRDSDLIFWVGEGIEGFMGKATGMLGNSVTLVKLYDEPDITLRSSRINAATHGFEQDNHLSQNPEQIDGHLWLDPHNAIELLGSFARRLAEIDPENRDLYAKNAKDYQQQLMRLSDAVTQQLSAVKTVPFVVFHDSFQYFEKRYGLSGVGVVARQPEVQPGARGLQHTLDTIKEEKVRCLFSEPQFPARSVRMLVDQTGVRHARIDPLGSTYEAGSQMYLEWFADIAQQVSECLSD